MDYKINLVNDKIVAEFLYKGIGKKLVETARLKGAERKHVMDRSHHISFLRNRPNLRRIFENTFTVMKDNGGYTNDEYLDICKKAMEAGYIPQWNVKRAHGGGQGAHACGKIEFGKTQIIEDILKEADMLDEFKALPIEKRLNRIQKLIGECVCFKTEPKVKIGYAAKTYDGIVWAKPSWMRFQWVQRLQMY